MKTVPIELNGVLLSVTGEYSPAEAQTWTDPGWDASFVAYTVIDKGSGIDVTHLHEDDMDEIEALALEAVGDEHEYAREQTAEWRREERMLGEMR